MKKILVVFTAAIAVFSSISVHAQIVSPINFQVQAASYSYTGDNPAYTGPGFLGTGNQTWKSINAGANGINGASPAGGTSATDPTSGVKLTVTYAKNYGSSTPPIELFQGYAIEGAGGIGTIDFSNLQAGVYNLVLYSQNGTYTQATAPAETDFTFGGNSLYSTETNDSTFSSGANFVEFTGLTVSASGTLDGTFTAPTGFNEADFNGAQLVQATPEPSTYALMAASLGALVLVARRRLNA